MVHINCRIIAISIIVLSMIVIYAIFSWLSPVMIDDLMFWHKYLDANNGDATPSLLGYWCYIRDLWLYENGRLANMLCAPVVLWMPKIVWNVFLACVISCMYLISARIINNSWNFEPLLLVVVWIAYIFILPWHESNSLVIIDYALNYFLSTVVVLLTIWAAWHMEFSQMKNRYLYIGILLMGFVCGLFHEGFSFPLIATLFCIACLNCFKMNCQWWGLFVAVLIGMLICAGSPAIWERFFTSVDADSHFHLKPYIRMFIKNTTLFAGISILMFVCAFFKRGRRCIKHVFSDQINVYLILLGIYSSSISYVL